MKRMRTIVGMTLALVLAGSVAWGQTAPAQIQAGPDSTETYYLANVSQINDMNDILIALRNMLNPKDRLILVPSQNAIVMQAPTDQIAIAKKLLSELDRPRRTYRLTYTVRDLDDNKQVGIQHFSLLVVSGARTTLRNGSRVPIVTSSSGPSANGSGSEFTFTDVGLNIDVSLDESASGVRLRTKMERSSVVEDKSIAGIQQPVIRQTVLEGTSILTQGKPAVLGSLDIPGSTRHLDVEVSLAIVP